MTRSAAKLTPVENDDDVPEQGKKKSSWLLMSLLTGSAMMLTGYALAKASKKPIPRLPAPEAEVIELGRS